MVKSRKTTRKKKSATVPEHAPEPVPEPDPEPVEKTFKIKIVNNGTFIQNGKIYRNGDVLEVTESVLNALPKRIYELVQSTEE